MLLRLLPLAAIATLTLTQRAEAAGAWLPSGAATPIEQRVAIALGPARSTLWTSLRVDASKGPFGVVVPVAPGAALDHSSDAWFEALVSATAPRVFPPLGASPYCPGENTPDPDPFHVTESLDATASVAPVESVVLQDAAAVITWANQHGFGISPDIVTKLEGMPDKRFFAERFDAPGGPFVTSTLRVVSPTPEPTLPLTLTRAGLADLRVTAFVIGEGEASLTGGKPITLPTEELRWDAGNLSSNYVPLRTEKLLAKGFGGVVVEAASHDALVVNTPIAGGTSSITGVVTSFFQRAGSYGDGNTSSSICITSAAVALDATYPVAESCPRADLGVVDGAPSCVESPVGAEIEPAKLRCGGIADDLSIALSGMVPRDAVLTRLSMLVQKNAAGSTWPVEIGPLASNVDPLLSATSIDLHTCGGGGGLTSSSSAGGSSTGGQGGASGVSVGVGASGPTGGYVDPGYGNDVGCACAGTPDPIIVDETGGGGGGDVVYYDDTSGDDCSGDTTTTDTYYDDTSGDDCSGDTTTTDTYYDDTSSDDCSGDTSSDSYYDDTSSDCGGDSSSSSSDTDCSSDTSDSSSDTDCSSDSGDSGGTDYWSEASSASPLRAKVAASTAEPARVHQATTKLKRRRGPKASVMTLGLFALLAPLRRLARPDRSRRAAKEKSRRRDRTPS